MNKQQVIKTIYGHLSETEDECSGGTFDQGYDQGCEFCIALIEQLDEPKKVVVPKFVAEWIGYATLKGDSLSASFKPWDLYGAEYGKVNSWIKDNEETYARAWIHGYEVETEQLYYVKLPDLGYLVRHTKNGHQFINTEILENSRLTSKFTENQIKSIDERYWPFAVKVEGGE